MPLYLTQVSYTQQAWQSLIENPQNRFEVVRAVVEKLGGKVVNGWAAFGDYDVILISEMPDQVSAAAFAMAIAGGGACKNIKTTPLLSIAEVQEALKKAGGSGYAFGQSVQTATA
jgi:uncharacterized protein with GYD domain